MLNAARTQSISVTGSATCKVGAGGRAKSPLDAGMPTGAMANAGAGAVADAGAAGAVPAAPEAGASGEAEGWSAAGERMDQSNRD
jgi:hypothetical protein